MKPALCVDGVEVFVEGEGTASLVMVHGWPDTWRLWDAQVAHLAPSYRCVRFTLPGFDTAQPARARSLDEMVETLRRIVLAACPQGRVVLMLHDWGCVFGYALLRRHPQLATRVIGVDIGDAGSAAHRASLSGRHRFGIFAYQAWLALAWCLRGSVGDRMTRAMARWLRCPAPAAAIAAQMNYPYFIQWTGRHGGYREHGRFEPPCPMLFVYGTRKPFMFHSATWADALAARPHCQVEPMRTGHWVMCNDAAGFNRVVQEWLQRT